MTTDEREDEIDKAECDWQYYEIHTPRCNEVTKQRGKKAGAVCHASAAEIYAACLKGVPKTERPDLMD